MSGVREVCPEPFKPSHLAVWRSYNGVQLLRRDPFDYLVAEIESSCEESDDVIFVCFTLPACSVHNVLRNIGPIHPGSYGAGVEIRPPYLAQDLAETKFRRNRLELVAIGRH